MSRKQTCIAWSLIIFKSWKCLPCPQPSRLVWHNAWFQAIVGHVLLYILMRVVSVNWGLTWVQAIVGHVSSSIERYVGYGYDLTVQANPIRVRGIDRMHTRNWDCIWYDPSPKFYKGSRVVLDTIGYNPT